MKEDLTFLSGSKRLCWTLVENSEKRKKNENVKKHSTLRLCLGMNSWWINQCIVFLSGCLFFKSHCSVVAANTGVQ